MPLTEASVTPASLRAAVGGPPAGSTLSGGVRGGFASYAAPSVRSQRAERMRNKDDFKKTWLKNAEAKVQSVVQHVR